MSSEIAFEHKQPSVIALLSIVTCGIYGFILLYSWIKAVNRVSTKKKLDPVIAIILSIVTCGLASIYFEYEIAVRVEKIIQEKKASGSARSDSMAPPVKNLKNIVLFGSLAVVALSFFSAGFLSVLAFIFLIWVSCAIQYALEYALDTPQD